MKEDRPPRSGWSQKSPRLEMVLEAKSLDSANRAQQFAIRYGKPGHIDDEVIVTLFLDAWCGGQDGEADTYASELLRRITMQVRAHVRKNSGWQQLGGGAATAIDDFCQEVVLAILGEKAVPCHAEVAFGNYVYRRCLDEAGKLYAKKRSAATSLDDGEDGMDAAAQGADLIGPLTSPKPPDEVLVEIDEFLADHDKLERIRQIVQFDLPELPQLAFTFRFFRQMKIESKNQDEVTVTRVMGVTEKTATKYINHAIAIIKQRLANE